VTDAQAQMARFDADKQRAWGSDGRFFFAPTQWFRLGPYFVHLRGRGESPGSLEQVTLYQVDDSFQLVRRFDAQRLAHLERDRWRLIAVTIREFAGTVPVKSQVLDTYELELPRSSVTSFDVQLGRPESMTLSALREQIRIRRRSNQPVMAYAWAMHQRFAYPLLGVVAALLSSLLGLRSKQSASLTQALAEGLVVMLAVFTILVASKTLALSQHVSAGVASWVPLGLLGGAVALLYRQQERSA
jgi:lipopolysaccharide export system permease protein